MELLLNLAWLLLALAMSGVWAVRRQRTELRVQIIALAMLILVLFPVISMSDDLQALQNPAEADCCLRRDHVVASTHSIFPAVATLPQPILAEQPVVFLLSSASGNIPVQRTEDPARAQIQNRPPPFA